MNYREIKSYEDACKALGLKPIADEVFNAFQQEDRRTMAAYHKLAVITCAINEGWQPDWSNRNERKYEPYMYTNSAGLASANSLHAPSLTATYLGSRLCFRDYERAAFAVETFGDTLYKDYFRPENYGEQKAEAADNKEQNAESKNGGDVKTERHIDDLTDAPDFLQKVGEITTKQIQPLQEKDMENRAIILIAVQDNAEDEDGDKGLAATFAVAGSHDTLAKGLARFLQHKQSQEIIKSAFLRVKVERLFKHGAKVLKDIIDNF